MRRLVGHKRADGCRSTWPANRSLQDRRRTYAAGTNGFGPHLGQRGGTADEFDRGSDRIFHASVVLVGWPDCKSLLWDMRLRQLSVATYGSGSRQRAAKWSVVRQRIA